MAEAKPEYCEHCGTAGWGSDHAIDCPNNPVPGHGTGTVADYIADRAISGFRSDVERIMTGHPEDKAGDMTTEQQCQMVAEASAWRTRALKAESQLASLPHDNEAPEVIQADKSAAAEFLGLTAKRATGVLSATHNRELTRLAKAFARHRLTFASPAEPAPGAGGGEGMTLADAFDMGRGWQSMLTGQTMEDSRAVGRTLGCDLFKPIAAAIDREEKRLGFNPFQSADLGICQAIRIIHAAFPTPSLPAGREAIAEVDMEALAKCVHEARFNGPPSWPWENEDQSGKTYCYRIANAVHLHLLAIRPSVAGSGEWQTVDSAPHACHVLAARFDDSYGEWVYAVVASPPSKLFTHWRPLLSPPSEKGETK